MVRISPAIRVAEQVLAGGHAIRVLAGDRRDRERNSESCRAEDALWPEKWNPDAIQVESSRKGGPSQLTICGAEVGQPLERREPDSPLPIDHRRPGYGGRRAPICR
jgi:hypothetical protein